MIRKAREDKGWFQGDLAERLHCERSTVAGWENNTHKPNHATLQMIADLTGYPIETFAGVTVTPRSVPTPLDPNRDERIEELEHQVGDLLASEVTARKRRVRGPRQPPSTAEAEH